MKNFVSKVSELISIRFFNNEYQAVVEELTYLRDSSLTYNSDENSNLSVAVQAAEDRRFLYHKGFHIRGIARAIVVYITHRKVQGASTIEQQLVRVIRNRYELSIGRKISEILIASSLNEIFDKKTLMELYMEVAYFGWSGCGIVQICNRLDLEANSLNINQACLIAAMVKLPMPRNPSNSYISKLDRRKQYIWIAVHKSEGSKRI